MKLLLHKIVGELLICHTSIANHSVSASLLASYDFLRNICFIGKGEITMQYLLMDNTMALSHWKHSIMTLLTMIVPLN